MRILFLTNEVIPERAGGVATYTSTIAAALAARGHDVHVLSCAPEHTSRDDRSRGVWWHRRPLVGTWLVGKARFPQSHIRLATALSCRSWLRRLGYRFDLIESPEWMAQSLLIGRSEATPLVVHLHTPLNILFAYTVTRFNADLRVADRLERSSVRRATTVTAASRLLADTLSEKGWLTQRATIIPLPVDTEAWTAVPSVLGSAPKVLVVGRLERRKAPEVAVEAVELLGAEIAGVELVFLGRSNGLRDGRQYGDWVAELASRKGVKATFIGQRPHDEVQEVYGRARAVVVPSRFESFSIAALEGMAAARPVVVTSRVGAAEILCGSRAGGVVPPDDPRALADALRPYLLRAEEAAEAGGVARELARTRCAPDVIAAERERCFEEAIAAHAEAIAS